MYFQLIRVTFIPLLFHISLVKSQDDVEDDVDVEDFSVVTSMTGLEELYMDMRRLKPKRMVQEIDEDKNSICSSILSSNFFIDGYPIVKLNDGSKPAPSAAPAHEPDSVHENAACQIGNLSEIAAEGYILCNVSLTLITIENRTRKEFVYPCLANSSTGVMEYLISQEYSFNWNWWSRVRLVFAYNERGDAIIPFALAERPIEVWTEFENLAEDDVVRDLFTSTDRGEICGYPAHERIRFCAAALKAPQFAERVEYSPYKDVAGVNPECKEREFLLRYNKTEYSFRGWAIECKVLEKTKRAIYGISIGFDSEYYYISRSEDDLYVILGHFHHLLY